MPLNMLYVKYTAVLVHDISETGGNFQNFCIAHPFEPDPLSLYQIFGCKPNVFVEI